MPLKHSVAPTTNLMLWKYTIQAHEHGQSELLLLAENLGRVLVQYEKVHVEHSHIMCILYGRSNGRGYGNYSGI